MAYAIRADVAAYMGIDVNSLPSNIDHLIDRAADVIDRATLYRIDTTKPDHADAANKAVCAQVEYWMEIGEEADIAGAHNFTQHNMGGVALTGRFDTLAPRARRHLFKAGLLYRGVGRL